MSDTPDDHPARHTDPQTSHDAARANRRFRQSQKNRLLVAHGDAVDTDLNYQGLTADEAWLQAGGEVPSLSTYWHRHGDLAREGYLEVREGVVRVGRAGKNQQVLQMTLKGWSRYQELIQR